MGTELYSYDQAAGLYRCAYPGCSYSHKSPNGAQMHYAGKHVRHAATATAAASTTTTTTATPEARLYQGHQHEWRLLDRSQPRQARAYNAGYKEVCAGCLELR